MIKFWAGATACLVGLCAGYGLAARNASGTYSKLYTFSPGTTINSSNMNSQFSDLETEMSDSKSRSGKGDFSAPVRGADGTVSAPTWSYTSETGSGLYRIGSSDHGFSMAGTKVGEWTANGYRTANGAVATPSLSFFNDTGSGLYRGGSNDIRFAINGADKTFWNATGFGIGAAPTALFDVEASGSGSTNIATFLEASLANGNSALLYLGKAATANNAGNISYTPNATAANSTMCVQMTGQTSTLCVDGNNATSIGGATTVAGTFKVGSSNVSTVSGFTRGGCTLNGASPAVCTATVVSGQTCTASFAGTTAPPSSGLRTNNAAGTLSVYGANGSVEGVNYTCF